MNAEPPTDPARSLDIAPNTRRRDALHHRLRRKAGPGTRVFRIAVRVARGAWEDGSIHAGNLAYMTLLSLFPFFIALAAIFSALGERQQLGASIDAVLQALPPRVAEVLGPVAHDVAAARHGWLLWIGGLFGLWTAASLVETIRDILHRAYGTPATLAFWRYRLLSTAMIVAAVVLLLLSLFAQVAITAAEEVISVWFPRLDTLAVQLAISRVLPTGALYLSLFILFISLTPKAYRGAVYPKWPGALLVTAWWVAVSVLLPGALRLFFTYDLTYGSLAGVMIALFFFWLVGLGMVIGAELNAALAETPEEQDMLGQVDNRARNKKRKDRDT